MQYSTGETPANQPENYNISSGPFWPVIDSESFYNDYTIPASLAAGIVRSCLRLAIVRVNNSARSFQASQIVAGYNKLTDIPADLVDDVHPKEELYRRAVFCEAKANVLKETQTIDRKEVAENIAKTSEETEDKYRELSQIALRDLCDRKQVGCETI